MLRRSFLQRFAVGVPTVALAGSFYSAATTEARAQLAARPDVAPATLARDEAFWATVTRQFAPAPEFINLEYGYFHAAALPTLEAQLRYTRYLNTRNSHYKRTEMRGAQEAARTDLAALAGVSPEEIAIVRNTTEALNIVIGGLDLQPGDEIVYSDVDYGSMVEAMEQKARRHGVVLKKISLPLDPKDDAEVVERFAAALTPRTKLLHVTWMVNLTGQILPVRKICDLAHARGAEVMVDGAHAFAHVDLSIADLDCDYLGSSLHKWLCAPLGAGLLYVKRDKIPKVWPLMGDTRLKPDDIRKLEQLGTRDEAVHFGLQEAIRFHHAIGGANKLARLRYLHRTWADAVRGLPGVQVLTPSDPARHGGVGNIAVAGVEPVALAAYWMNEHNIFTVGIGGPVIRGVRVTPGVPTPVSHVHRFVEAVEAARKKFV